MWNLTRRTLVGFGEPARHPSLDTPVTGADLRAACDAVLAGDEPDWFGV